METAADFEIRVQSLAAQTAAVIDHSRACRAQARLTRRRTQDVIEEVWHRRNREAHRALGTRNPQ